MKYAKWRQRLRGTFKWGGVTLCALLFVIWITSRWYFFHITIGPLKSAWFSVYCYWGMGVMRGPGHDATDWVESHFGVTSFNNIWLGIIPSNWAWWPWGYDAGPPRAITFPFSLPLLLIALPTGFLFWSDHRKRTRVGCCAMCGYDLKGNTSGKCPECGETTVKAAT